MRLILPLSALFLASLPASATAAMVGDVAACAARQSAILVRVSGFKEVRGTVRVRLYEESGWLKRGRSLSRIRAPVTGSSLEICVKVPAAGRYAVALHHDLNGNRDRDQSDGAGFSRNPRLSLAGRPSFASTSVMVGRGVTPVGIQMMYLRGLTIGPAGAR